MTIENAAREIAEDIDFGDLSPAQILRMLSREECRSLDERGQLKLAQQRQRESHVESITAILRKHFQPESAAWLPIESAPKDGKWIIVVGPLKEKDNPTWRGMPRACVSRFFTEEDYRDSPSFSPGWCYSAPGYSSLIEPTHWMPLPLPIPRSKP